MVIINFVPVTKTRAEIVSFKKKSYSKGFSNVPYLKQTVLINVQNAFAS